MNHRHLRVEAGQAGERLDRFLAAALPAFSRARLQQLIGDGHVAVDGRPASSKSVRLAGGQEVAVEVPAPQPAAPQPEALPLRVVYQDAQLAVVDKAAGVVVHPGAGHRSGTLVNALLHHLKDLRGVGGELRPGIVHRLDKDTSGLLVVAKDERSLEALQEAFQSRRVEKTYLALVRGRPAAAEAELRTLYGRHPRQRLKFSSKVKTGKLAVTRYRVLREDAGTTLLEVSLETGRTHQIRVHLADLGHPLVGDVLYGGQKEAGQGLGRQALHAWKLGFPHPATGRMRRFTSPPPGLLAP